MNTEKIKQYFISFFINLYNSYIPNKKDNIKQIILKVLFIICFIALIVSSIYIINYFWQANRQDNIINDSRELWHNAQKVETESYINEKEEQVDPFTAVKEAMLKENSDFKGWITINGTKVDNPIYQTTNNEFYLNRNQKKQYSAYGALYFDYENKITEDETDKNLVIYGHEMKNGSMFGSLKRYKSLSFYKQYPTIDFSTLYDRSTYKIYSVFLLNSVKADDNNYIYNIYRNSFLDATDFNEWVSEAKQRSIINTTVDVELNDDIITLVTCSEDFENARLVIMARRTRDGEDKAVDTYSATINPNIRYPKRWYDERKLDYPFD